MIFERMVRLLRQRHIIGLPLLALGALTLGHGLLLAPLPLGWHGVVALLLLALLPGLLLATLLLPHERDPLERAALSVALGLSFLALLTLALHAIPGPLPPWLMLGSGDLFVLVMVAALWRRQGQAGRWNEASGVVSARKQTTIHGMLPASCCVALLLLAAALRLTNLGYSEFQGDEARAALLAAAVVDGRDDLLLIHQKGPVEVLLPAASYALLGGLNEWNARLPFAAANLAALLLVHGLGRRLVGPHGQLAGVLALAALAVSGYMVAFSRIVQYQSVVLLCSVAAAWCCVRYWQDGNENREQRTENREQRTIESQGTREQRTKNREQRTEEQRGRGSEGLRLNNAPEVGGGIYLYLAGLFCGVGVLAHYEGSLVLPALLVLFGGGARRRGLSLGAQVRVLALPALLFVVLLAMFYVPFVLSPSFAGISEYLAARVAAPQGGSGVLYNNLRFYFHLSFFYSTTYQVLALGLALLAALVIWLLRYVRPLLLGRLLAVLLLLGLLLAFATPLLLVVREVNLAVLLIAPPLLTLLGARRTPLPLRTLLLWWALPFLLASFGVRKPGTHFYTAEPAWALLAAAAVAGWIGPRWARWHVAGRGLALAAAGGLLALAAGYAAIVYARVSPEYKRVFPDARPAIYAAPYGDELPNGGYFGFPYRGGWKAIGYLYQQGLLSGTYDTNEEDLITGWYLRGAPRCYWLPQYYFVAQQVQDVHWIPMDVVREQYRPIGSVSVGGGEKIAIYSRTRNRALHFWLPPGLLQPAAQPGQADLPLALVAEGLEEQYDRLTPPRFPLGPSLGPGLLRPVPDQKLDIKIQPGALLLGYDLYGNNGPNRYLTLYWRGEGPLPDSYAVQVELQDAAGSPLAVASSPCGDRPPASWQGLDYVTVIYEIPSPAATAARITLMDGATQVGEAVTVELGAGLTR